MTTYESEAVPITAADVRALRCADAIVFSTYKGRSVIRAILRAESSSTGFDQERAITVSARITDYAKDHPYVPADDVSGYAASAMVHTPSMDDVWQTIRARIRPNDSVMLRWIRDNNTGYITEVGYHCDELRLVITKPSGKTETYIVDSSICPDNS